MLEKESLYENQADNPSVTSIYLIQSDEPFETKDHDQRNNDSCNHNITISCCHGEEGCVTNLLSDICMTGNKIENHYYDKHTMSPAISPNFNDGDTKNNKIEKKNNNNDTCFIAILQTTFVHIDTHTIT